MCAEIRSRWETTVQYILAVFRKCHSWKKLQNYNPSDSLKRRYKKRKETASRSFLYSASCYEKNRYIPYFSKTTQRNDAHGSKMSDESKVDQLRRNCSAQIKQPQKGKIKSNNLHFFTSQRRKVAFVSPAPQSAQLLDSLAFYSNNKNI